MNRNERGLTLIEVLVALSILSIIGIIIWNVFFQGLQYSKKSISKNFMIQETNLLITNLTRIHQTATSYTISKSGSCGFTINVDGQPKILDLNPNICFEITIGIDNKDANSTPINPYRDKVDLKLIARDKNNQSNNNFVEINTILTRLKKGVY